MIELARSIGQQHAAWTLPADGPSAVRAVFDQLSKDYPKSDEEMIDWYRQTAFRLVEYARKTGMFDVPADYKLDVIETPPPLDASIDGAAYYPAPPFKNSGVGRFYVTPTHNDTAALASEQSRGAGGPVGARGFPRSRLVLQGHDAVARPHLAGPLAHARRGRGLVVDVGRLDAGRRLGTLRRSADGRAADRTRRMASTRRRSGSISCRASCIAICACASTPASTPAGCRTTRR